MLLLLLCLCLWQCLCVWHLGSHSSHVVEHSGYGWQVPVWWPVPGANGEAAEP